MRPTSRDELRPASQRPEASTTGPAAAGLVAVGPPLRNGHALVLGRVLDVVVRLSCEERRTLLHLRISRLDERELRDADDHQLSNAQLAIARSGSDEEWREALALHFKHRYHIILVFDGDAMSAE
jgi:hypothetical protein